MDLLEWENRHEKKNFVWKEHYHIYKHEATGTFNMIFDSNHMFSIEHKDLERLKKKGLLEALKYVKYKNGFTQASLDVKVSRDLNKFGYEFIEKGVFEIEIEAFLSVNTFDDDTKTWQLTRKTEQELYKKIEEVKQALRSI